MEDKNNKVENKNPNNLRPCCVCKDTREKRDLCIITSSTDKECLKEIQAHNECLKSYGFVPDK